MNINRNMSIYDLALRMGSDATEEQAEAMRVLLIAAGHDGDDTADIPENEWNDLLRKI